MQTLLERRSDKRQTLIPLPEVLVEFASKQTCHQPRLKIRQLTNLTLEQGSQTKMVLWRIQLQQTRLSQTSGTVTLEEEQHLVEGERVLIQQDRETWD